MTQITKTTDLLFAVPIVTQIANCGVNSVRGEVAKYVTKCSTAIDVPLSPEQTEILVDDIIDVYKWDSIEDIQICLKNGRQGKYGKTYGKLNMIVFTEWMTSHLEEKSTAREQAMQKAKDMHKFESREDYEEAVKVGAENQARIAALKKAYEDKQRALNADFVKIREQYLNKKK